MKLFTKTEGGVGETGVVLTCHHLEDVRSLIASANQDFP